MTETRKEESALPAGFEGFGFAEEVQQPPAQQTVEKEAGALREARDASRFLKPSALRLVEGGQLGLYQQKTGDRKRSWSVEVKASNEADARRQGEKIRSQLKSKRSLDSSVPYLHHSDLHVIYQGGRVLLPGPPEVHKARDKTALEYKKRIQSLTSKRVFGNREAGYRVGGAKAPTLQALEDLVRQTWKHSG